MSDEASPSSSKVQKARRPPGRTRAACHACRTNKQKCDASQRFPCKRCELYNIDCIFEPSPSSQQPTRVAHPPAPGAAVDARLQEIVDRLGRIEFAITGSTSSPPDAMMNGAPTRFDRGDAIMEHATDDGPMQQIRRTTNKANAIPDGMLAPFDQVDAISRGIVTDDLARELYNFYFEKLHSSFPMADVTLDSDPVSVRNRSALLFNAIILTAAYYVLLSSDRGRATYAALVNLHAELLGPILLFSRIGTSHVSRDTLIALMIVTCRKPIQQADSVGSAIPLVTQVVSKFNDSMAYISVGLMIRIAGLLGLRKHMMRVLGVAGPASPSTEDVALCRAFFYLYIIDRQASTQAGRRFTLDTIDDETLAERFAALNRQTGDLRLASMVTASDLDKRTYPGSNAPEGVNGVNRHSYDMHALQLQHTMLERWRARWQPALLAERINDAHGLWATSLIVRFRQVVTFSRFVSKWLSEFRAIGVPAHRIHTALSEEQWAVVQNAVSTSEEVLFFLSTEARTMNNEAGRAVQWPIDPSSSPSEKYPKFLRLTPDPEITVMLATVIDTVINVIIPFPALFLASHAGRVYDCNLNRLPNVTDTQPPFTTANRMHRESKLRRLFDLVADTLELAAPNPTHPSMAFARTLRSLITVGIRAEPLAHDPLAPGATESLAPSGIVAQATNETTWSTAPNMPGLATDAFVAPIASMSSSYTSPPMVTSQPSMPSLTLIGGDTVDYNSLFGTDLEVDWGALGLSNDGLSAVYDLPAVS